MSKKVLVFGASASSTSINKQFATYASTFVKNAQVTLIDLRDYYEVDIYHQGAEKGKIPEKIVKFNALLDSHDAYLISLAENNFTYTAAWKNILDWISRTAAPGESGYTQTFRQKPMLIIGTSPVPSGAQETIGLAAKTWPWLGAKVTGSFSLPKFYENFKEGKIVNEEFNKNFQAELDKFNATL